MKKTFSSGWTKKFDPPEEWADMPPAGRPIGAASRFLVVPCAGDVPIVEQVLGGSYDPKIELFEPTVLDVGAHVGAFAAWAAEKWPGCSIRCYEPALETYRALCLNVAGIDEVKLATRAAVVGERAKMSGTGLLLHSARGCASENSLFRHPCSGEDGEWVPLMDAEDLPPCEVFKLDVEGAEAEVLPRYQHFANVRAALVEAHGMLLDRFCKDFFLDLGFSLVRQDVGDLIFVRP